MKLLSLFLQLALKLAAPAAVFFGVRQKAKTDEIKKDAEQAARDATAWANRPDDSDAVVRLRAWAERLRKDRT